MSDPITELDEASGLVRLVLRVARKPISRIFLEIRVRWGGLRDRLWPPLRTEEARDIAFEVLRGNILTALPFRNLGSAHKFLAVLRSDSQSDLACEIHLLEGFAGQYREVFTSEPLYWANALKELFSVEDMDGDGQKELIFGSASRGTGAGVEILMIYVPSLKKCYKFVVEHQWQEPAKPPTSISLEPESNDEVDRKWFTILERKVQSVGFVEPLKGFSLDDPENAVTRWHIENQSSVLISFRPHYYPGYPRKISSVMAQVEDGEITWIAYFKGAVYGFVASENKHFVLYSPACAYNWPTSLVADSRYLWIGTRGEGIIRYDKQNGRLRRIQPLFEGAPIRDVDSLRTLGDLFEINGRVLFKKDELTRE